MTVTAEGVETAEQLLLLRHDACEEVQGFLMSRPMSADALQSLVWTDMAAEELTEASFVSNKVGIP